MLHRENRDLFPTQALHHPMSTSVDQYQHHRLRWKSLLQYWERDQEDFRVSIPAVYQLLRGPTANTHSLLDNLLDNQHEMFFYWLSKMRRLPLFTTESKEYPGLLTKGSKIVNFYPWIHFLILFSKPLIITHMFLRSFVDASFAWKFSRKLQTNRLHFLRYKEDTFLEGIKGLYRQSGLFTYIPDYCCKNNDDAGILRNLSFTPNFSSAWACYLQVTRLFHHRYLCHIFMTCCVSLFSNMCWTASVACSRTSIITTVSFPRPFLGRVFAKGYGPDECTVQGNGSNTILFRTNTNKCGIKFVNQVDEPSLQEMQLYLYVRYDGPVSEQVARVDSTKSSYFDERIFVRCTPQEILLSGSMGRNSHHRLANASSMNGHLPDKHELKPQKPLPSQSVLTQLSPSLMPSIFSMMRPQSADTLVKRRFENQALSQSSPQLLDEKTKLDDKKDSEDENPSRIFIKTMNDLKEVSEAHLYSLASPSKGQESLQDKIDVRMDIFRGRLPDLQVIDARKPIDVGDEVTVLVTTNYLG